MSPYASDSILSCVAVWLSAGTDTKNHMLRRNNTAEQQHAASKNNPDHTEVVVHQAAMMMQTQSPVPGPTTGVTSQWRRPFVKKHTLAQPCALSPAQQAHPLNPSPTNTIVVDVCHIAPSPPSQPSPLPSRLSRPPFPPVTAVPASLPSQPSPSPSPAPNKWPETLRPGAGVICICVNE